MSSNGPPPNKHPDFERIKTKLQQAGLSLEEIEKTFQAAKEAVRVLGAFLEEAGISLEQARRSLTATSPPPPKKKTATKPSKQESTDNTSDFVLGVFVGDLLDETS